MTELLGLLGADTDTLDRIAESLRADAARMLDLRTQAQRAMTELQGGWVGHDLWSLTQQWEQETSPQLTRATTSLDTCAAVLHAQSTAQRSASRSTSDGNSRGRTSLPLWLVSGPALGIPLVPQPGATPSGVAAPTAPPPLGSPADNAGWWRSLRPAQQVQLLEDHPRLDRQPRRSALHRQGRGQPGGPEHRTGRARERADAA